MEFVPPLADHKAVLVHLEGKLAWLKRELYPRPCYALHTLSVSALFATQQRSLSVSHHIAATRSRSAPGHIGCSGPHREICGDSAVAGAGTAVAPRARFLASGNSGCNCTWERTEGGVSFRGEATRGGTDTLERNVSSSRDGRDGSRQGGVVGWQLMPEALLLRL